MSPRRSSARLVDCFQLSATMKERRFQECCHEKLARKWPTKRQERCESGRIGLTANELSVERRTQGSNPCLSARWSANRVGNPRIGILCRHLKVGVGSFDTG